MSAQGGLFIRWPRIPKDSSIFVPAEPALSRPALCHVTCFVICYTNPPHIAQVLQTTFHKKKFMHHRCCMLFTSGTTEDTEERRGANHKGHEAAGIGLGFSNFGNSGDYGDSGNTQEPQRTQRHRKYQLSSIHRFCRTTRDCVATTRDSGDFFGSRSFAARLFLSIRLHPR